MPPNAHENLIITDLCGYHDLAKISGMGRIEHIFPKMMNSLSLCQNELYIAGECII